MLRDVCTLITKGTTPVEFSTNGIKYIKIDSLNGNYIDNSKVKYISESLHTTSLSRSILKENDVLLAIAGSVGKHCIVQKENLPANTNQALAIIRIKDKLLPYYLHAFFDTNYLPSYIKHVCVASAQPNLNLQQVSHIRLSIPSIQEQGKVCSFVQLLDKRISVQNKIISKYETLIKGIRHRIFDSIDSDKQNELGSFLEEYSEKNVTNNLRSVAVGKYGIRKREDIYSKSLSADYTKNKVIRKNTLIIGMGSTQIDIGILATDDCYCVSPAYTTYRIKGINSSYLQEYLIKLNPLLSVRYMITSARQGKAVNKNDLMKHLLLIHPKSEQKKICHCFENLYKRLQIEKEMLYALQKQKTFLLQSMFI